MQSMHKESRLAGRGTTVVVDLHEEAIHVSDQAFSYRRWGKKGGLKCLDRIFFTTNGYQN